MKVKRESADRLVMEIEVTLTAGLLDYSKALPLLEGKDVGDVPKGVFVTAEECLKTQILSAFEKCRACGCDLFGVTEHLQKYNHQDYEKAKDTALQNTSAKVSVKFLNVR